MKRIDNDTIERLYSRGYYLEDCEGYEEFTRSSGTRLSKRLRRVLAVLDPKKHERILDLGCGRGELLRAIAAAGASVQGVDPAPSATRIARQLDSHVVRARGDALPFRDQSFEAVTMSDVVEHLTPVDLQNTLDECHRVLVTGGRLVIHTQPNRLLVDWTVPVLSRISLLWGVTLPGDLRTEMTPGSGSDYHVNEQSSRQLELSLLEAGFEIEELWLEGTYPLHRLFGDARFKPLLVGVFRRTRWIKNLLASQIFAVGRCR